MSEEVSPKEWRKQDMDSGTLTALAHLYRAEVFRSTHWRTRLDNTTNWAVVTTGIALSATFSNVEASPLPMVLVGLLVSVFLVFEARRYRYYNMFRARARLLESDLYAPILHGRKVPVDARWTRLLAEDYEMPHLPYLPGARGGTAAQVELFLDPGDPGGCLLRQGRHPPGAADKFR